MVGHGRHAMKYSSLLLPNVRPEELSQNPLPNKENAERFSRNNRNTLLRCTPHEEVPGSRYKSSVGSLSFTSPRKGPEWSKDLECNLHSLVVTGNSIRGLHRHMVSVSGQEFLMHSCRCLPWVLVRPQCAHSLTARCPWHACLPLLRLW